MRDTLNVRSLSDDELLRRLSEVLKDSRRIEADLIAHIAEVDARKLYRREAVPSMFVYCTDRLHLSEQEAYLRIAAARASREHPVLLTMLRDGRLHLSGIDKLAPHLTPGNRDELLKQATHRSKRQIEEMVAALVPQPEARTVIRRLPAPSDAGVVQTRGGLGPDRVDSSDPEPCRSGKDRGLSGSVAMGGMVPELGPDRVPGPGPGPSTVVEARAPDRFRLHFDASAELCQKLERLQALMRRSRLDADLAAVVEAAVTEKLERLEARRFARAKTPRKALAEADTAPKSRRIPAPVRRAVYERDGGRCTYTDARGRRCPNRDDLEFHHEGTPFGKAGDHSTANVRLMCRPHNLLRAEQEYGEEVMARFRRRASRASEPMAVYAVGASRRMDGAGLAPD